MNRAPFFILITIISLFTSLPALSQFANIHHTCAKTIKKKVKCDIRFAKPWDASGSPEKVEIVWPDDHRQQVEFEAYNPNEKKTVWLLLFDRSKSLKKQSVKIIQEDFGKIISGLRSKEKIAIATFAENVLLLSSFDDDRTQHLQVLKDIKPVGDSTLLHQSAIDALEELKAYEADRKALVIISDGISEDNTVSFREVINQAKESNIVIYGIGYSEKPQNDIYLNELVEMARETQGPFQRAQLHDKDTRILEPQLMQYFLDYMQNGGSATFEHRMHERGEVSVNLVATLSDGRQLSKKIKLPEVFVAEKPGLFENLGIPKKYDVFIIAAISGFLVLMLLIFLVWFLYRGSSKKENTLIEEVALPSPNIGETNLSNTAISEGTISSDIVGDEKTNILPNRANGISAYGFLEQLDADSKRIELKSTTVSIGRHKDNDIQFTGSTVHRRHATLHMNSDKKFVITDLSGQEGNGIILNGNRITTSELKTGDMIELGDVRLRFLEAI